MADFVLTEMQFRLIVGLFLGYTVVIVTNFYAWVKKWLISKQPKEWSVYDLNVFSTRFDVMMLGVYGCFVSLVYMYFVLFNTNFTKVDLGSSFIALACVITVFLVVYKRTYPVLFMWLGIMMGTSLSMVLNAFSAAPEVIGVTMLVIILSIGMFVVSMRYHRMLKISFPDL